MLCQLVMTGRLVQTLQSARFVVAFKLKLLKPAFQEACRRACETLARETADGVELEDWVYGLPPGRITFVTFKGDKVVTVKEEYAGLGNIAQSPPQ